MEMLHSTLKDTVCGSTTLLVLIRIMLTLIILR